jgi:exonuclease SbcC
MKIESIKLENIRSHVKTLIGFSDGFNCLVGGLGTGKSSILYAVDFALFGEPVGRSYDYLLREGADNGRIVLRFVKNGKEYTIQRGLKRLNERISQDMEQLKFLEGERLIAEMKADAVTEQLSSVTGIDKELFREIIWVQQEHLKEVLNIAPSERQRRLDQLFGLSDYETSWTNLRPILRWYESESSALERDPDIVGIKELETKYNGAVKDLTTKESELEQAKTKLAEAEKRLEESATHLKELENVRRKNEELRQEETQLQAKIMSTEDLLARLTQEVGERRTRIEDLENRLGSLRNQEDSDRAKLQGIGVPTDIVIEQLQEHAETLLEQISSNRGGEENLRTEIKRSTQRVSNLEEENVCPLCLQVLGPDYKDKLMKRLRKETAEHKQKLKELEKNTEHLEGLRDNVNSIIPNLQTLRTQTEEVIRQKEAEKSLLDAAQEQIGEKKKDKKVLGGQLAKLRSKIRKFDVTELEKAEKLRRDAFEQFSDLKHKAQSVESQKNEVLKRLESLKERLDIAQEKAARLERVKKIVELTQEVRQAYRSIQPRLRGEFVTYLERVVQQVLDELAGAEGPAISVQIDDKYTPVVEGEGGYERSISNLSGGERTLLAFAYRLGIGQLIMQWRIGHGLRMLLLDEPTESLGREDGSIDRLAESLSRLKTVEQVIAVTHSEGFAEKADHVIRLEKRDNKSIVSVER